MGFYQFTGSDHILNCWLTLWSSAHSLLPFFFFLNKNNNNNNFKNSHLALKVTGMKSRCTTWLCSLEVVFLALSPSSGGTHEAMPLETQEAIKACSTVVTS